MNERPCTISKDIAAYLSSKGVGKLTLRAWAKHTNIEKWKDSVGRITGVGLVMRIKKYSIILSRI